MGFIIRSKKHYLTRFPLFLLFIIFIGLSPFIIGFTGAYLTELFTGEPCHEGNCFWMVLPWFGIFITLPLGGILLLVYFIIILIDTIKLMMQND